MTSLVFAVLAVVLGAFAFAFTRHYRRRVLQHSHPSWVLRRVRTHARPLLAILALACLTTLWSHHVHGIPWSLRLAERDWTVQCCSPEFTPGVFADDQFVAMTPHQLASILDKTPGFSHLLMVDTVVWLGHGSDVIPTVAPALLDALAHLRVMRVVVFHEAPFVDARIVQAMLAMDSHVEHLQLDHCHLTPHVWDTIASALLNENTAPRLATLHIEENDLATTYPDYPTWAHAVRLARPRLDVVLTNAGRS